MSDFSVHTVAKTEGHVNAVACDPQRVTEFVTVGKHVQFWVLDSREELSVAIGSIPAKFVKSMGGNVEFTCVSYSDNGLVYVGLVSGHITLWDPHTTSCLLHWSASSLEVAVIRYHGDHLLSGGADKKLKLWLVSAAEDDGECTVLLQDELQFDGAVTSCQMDDQFNLGLVLLAGDKTGTVSVSNAETGLTLRLVSEHKNGAAVTALAVSPLCSHWLIATADRRLSVWQASWSFQLSCPEKIFCRVFFASPKNDFVEHSAGSTRKTLKSGCLSLLTIGGSVRAIDSLSDAV
eukprot:sb/3467616/